MSVLIKGMKMPKTCWECFAENSLNVYVILFGEHCPFGERIVLPQEFDAKRGRHPSCPLIEVPTPHGRLIDANALADVFRGHIALYDSCPFSQLSFTDKARRDELQSSLAEVINAPTIIEAEEGEEE